MVDAPFSPAPVAVPVVPAPLIQGGQLAAIHLDLVRRLQLAFPPAQFAHEVMPAKPSKADWDRLTQRTPTIGLGFVSMQPERSGTRTWRGLSKWMLFLVVDAKTAAYGTLGASIGGVLSPGIYGLLSVAGVALQGHNIADVGSAAVGVGSIAYAEDYARDDRLMAVLNVDVPFDLVDAATLAGLDHFLRLGIRWADLPDLVGNSLTAVTTINEGT